MFIWNLNLYDICTSYFSYLTTMHDNILRKQFWLSFLFNLLILWFLFVKWFLTSSETPAPDRCFGIITLVFRVLLYFQKKALELASLLNPQTVFATFSMLRSGDIPEFCPLLSLGDLSFGSLLNFWIKQASFYLSQINRQLPYCHIHAIDERLSWFLFRFCINFSMVLSLILLFHSIIYWRTDLYSISQAPWDSIFFS